MTCINLNNLSLCPGLSFWCLNRFNCLMNRFTQLLLCKNLALLAFPIYCLFLLTPKLLNHLKLFSLGLKNSLFIHSSRLNTFSENHFVLWVYRFSRVLVRIVSWFSQEDWLGLIKASKEVNNLILPPKDLGVFLTVLEVEGGSFTGRSIEGLSEEFEGVHGYSRIWRFKKHQI